jgi:hypothetical protein
MCPFLASFKYNLNACLANTLRGFKSYNSEKVQEDLKGLETVPYPSNHVDTHLPGEDGPPAGDIELYIRRGGLPGQLGLDVTNWVRGSGLGC